MYVVRRMLSGEKLEWFGKDFPGMYVYVAVVDEYILN